MKLTSLRNVWTFTIRKCCTGSQSNAGNDQTTDGTKQQLMMSVPPDGSPLYSVEVTLLTTLSAFPQSHYSKDKDTDFVEKCILISVQFKALKKHCRLLRIPFSFFFFNCLFLSWSAWLMATYYSLVPTFLRRLQMIDEYKIGNTNVYKHEMKQKQRGRERERERGGFLFIRLICLRYN